MRTENLGWIGDDGAVADIGYYQGGAESPAQGGIWGNRGTCVCGVRPHFSAVEWGAKLVVP